MSNTKAFRVDWYPREAFMGFCKLKADEIGVLMQIINLIYSNNKPINNDPKFIGKNCNIQRSKCARIIENLLDKDEIYLDKNGMINMKRCQKEMAAIEERRKINSKNGKKGSDVRWNSEPYQLDNNGDAISCGVANTSTKSESLNNNHTNYDIEHYISDDVRKQFNALLPGQDIHFFIAEFNHEIIEGGRKPPSIPPGRAFLLWCKKYVENHPI